MLENTLNKLGSQAEVSEGIIYLNAYQKLFEREKVAEGVVHWKPYFEVLHWTTIYLGIY